MAKKKETTIFSLMKTVVLTVAVLWIAHFAAELFAIPKYGIVPRNRQGALGIITAPFFHGDINHLIANSVSLLILGSFLILLEKKHFFLIIVSVSLIGGTMTWCLARGNANHIGASGVIFGIFGYLVTAGIFKKNIKFILVSVLVTYLYWHMITGVLPGMPGISWESHLFGLIAGIGVAAQNKPKKKK